MGTDLWKVRKMTSIERSTDRRFQSPEVSGARRRRSTPGVSRIPSLIACAVTFAVAGLPGIANAQASEIDPLKGLYFNQNLGTQIPMDLPFKDETGKDVRIGDYFKDKPVILVPVFYNCQSSCLLIKEGLIKTLNSQKKYHVGRDFEVVVVSINHKETPELAQAMKEQYVEIYRYSDTGEGWHLLTGTKEAIHSLTQSVGFGFNFKEVEDRETKELSDQITHPSGIIILTPDGVTSLYLLGANYPASEVMRGLEQATANKVGAKTETILLGCFMYDPTTGKYRLVVQNALKVGGFATMFILFGSIAIMAFKNRRQPLYADKGGTN